VNFSKVQNEGVLKKFMEEAKKVSEQFNVKVCDLYPVWEKLIESGVDVTELLANKLNHPIYPNLANKI
jgi:UTP:GlnB (protein PII) uridylyltransferase